MLITGRRSSEATKEKKVREHATVGDGKKAKREGGGSERDTEEGFLLFLSDFSE